MIIIRLFAYMWFFLGCIGLLSFSKLYHFSVYYQEGEMVIQKVSSTGGSRTRGQFGTGIIISTGQYVAIGKDSTFAQMNKEFGINYSTFMKKYIEEKTPIPVWYAPPLYNKYGRAIYRSSFVKTPAPPNIVFRGILLLLLVMCLPLIILKIWDWKKAKLLVVAILLTFQGYSQAIDSSLLSYPMFISNTIENNAVLSIYNPPYEVRKVFSDTTQIKLKSPEEVIASIASSTSVDWDSFHTIGGMDNIRPKSIEHYNKIKKLTNEVVLFEIDYSLEFGGDDSRIAFVKFRIINGQKEKGINAGYFFRKIEDRWKLDRNDGNFAKSFALISTKPEIVPYCFVIKKKEEGSTNKTASPILVEVNYGKLTYFNIQQTT